MEMYLITGFLGSGKTTFLNYQLKHSTKRIGVLVNEFGQTSIDSVTIEASTLVELKNGSIFCSCLKSDFISSLIDLSNRALDILLIETSGLSDPSNFSDILGVVRENSSNSIGYKGCITLIDAKHFMKVHEVMNVVSRQIKQANHLLLNKIDLVDSTSLKETIKVVKSINEKATIHEVTKACISLSELNYTPSALVPCESLNNKDNRPFTRTIQLNGISHTDLKIFLDSITSLVLRAKGYVQIEDDYYKVDVVLNEFTITEVDDHEVKNELVIIMNNEHRQVAKLDKLIRNLY